MANRCKDIVNQKFTRLLVLYRVENYIKPSGNKVAQWMCQCDCGNKIVVRGDHLRHQLVRSCGCLRDEKASDKCKNNKKYNTYDLSGDYGIGYTENTNEIFLFDLEDYDKIKNYCWSINKDGYIYSSELGSNNIVFLHRLIMNPKDNELVDHIEHNKFDNRKSKLRIVNKSQNAMNSIIPINNTSGVKGVYWIKKYQKWLASIKINQRTINLGYYINFNDAVKALKDAEEKYFGEYSYDNSVKLQGENL